MKASTITNKSGWRIQIGTVLLLLLIWQGLSMYFSALLIPSPVVTLFAVFHMIKSGELLGPLLLSGGRMLIGFFTGMGLP